MAGQSDIPSGQDRTSPASGANEANAQAFDPYRIAQQMADAQRKGAGTPDTYTGPSPIDGKQSQLPELKFSDGSFAVLSDNRVDLYAANTQPGRQRPQETQVPGAIIQRDGRGFVTDVTYQNGARFKVEEVTVPVRTNINQAVPERVVQKSIVTATGEKITVQYAAGNDPNRPIVRYKKETLGVNGRPGDVTEYEKTAQGWIERKPLAANQLERVGRPFPQLQGIEVGPDFSVGLIQTIGSNKAVGVTTVGGRHTMIDLTNPLPLWTRDGPTKMKPVTFSEAPRIHEPDGRTAGGDKTEYRYEGINTPAGGPAQALSSYVERDAQGNVKEFGIRVSNDNSPNAWIIWQTKPGEVGLPLAPHLPPGPAREAQVQQYLQHFSTQQVLDIDAIRDHLKDIRQALNTKGSNPQVYENFRPLADHAFDAFDVRTDQYGRKYLELPNGENIVRGDDGRTYRSHGGPDGNRMEHWTVSRPDAQGIDRLRCTETVGSGQPLIEHFGYDQSGQRIIRYVKKYLSDPANPDAQPPAPDYYALGQGGKWLKWDASATNSKGTSGDWVQSDINIQAEKEGSITITTQQKGAPVSARRIYKSGGEEVFAPGADGTLNKTKMFTATGEVYSGPQMQGKSVHGDPTYASRTPVLDSMMIPDQSPAADEQKLKAPAWLDSQADESNAERAIFHTKP